MFNSYAVKTILTDNDISFKQWKDLEKLLNAPIYFCHPYYSWEKGLVENANKWIRHFIPKRTELQTVTEEKVAECLRHLNDRPREVLQFKTANEVYFEKIT